MSVKSYNRIWILFSLLLAHEYYALNFKPQWSILKIFGYTASPEPGRPLSLYLGWAGIGLMLLMNLYILKKRFKIFDSIMAGSLPRWLDFHIFCGLLGPTFIIFHCNFKVRGLVAISFWSMLVSASSGIIGRYFYKQLLSKKKEIEEETDHWSMELNKVNAAALPPVPEDKIQKIKALALRHVGVNPNIINSDGTIEMNSLAVFFSSVAGDIRLMIDLPNTLMGWPQKSRAILRNYALSERRRLFLEPFRNLMGYWHTFHTPFAVFMYIAAVIHIVTALLLGVKK